MCTTCCKQFQAWCRAFTATEVFLSILQAILLAFFVAFLTFLILHLIACSDNNVNTEKYDPSQNTTEEGISITTTAGINTSHGTNEHVEMFTTLAPGIECTWTPSVKTTVVSLYFEHDENLHNVTVASEFERPLMIQPEDDEVLSINQSNQSNRKHTDIKPFIMVLTKMSPHNMTVGCIVTIISELWAVTVASCVHSDEEINSLDSFVMMDHNFVGGQAHAISSMVIHPQYQRINTIYDIMLVKSKDKYITSKADFVKLPTLIDCFLITIGERLTILEFGKNWHTSKEVGSRDVREVSVHALPAWRCGAAPAVARLCAGRLRPAASPAPPSPPPAGTPLLRGRLLLGVASARTHRGVTDAPSLYVNLAPVIGWLNSVVAGE